ncbi:membrane protein insertase YidC [Jidongwangia harbinensis]|uniref:membrane protein insertase YidC n=1 Tax=Jidongwangia harbinensis TaxID=2878561 RepID=UPI001CD9467F|nr:membrane protein insertase YidC [Jidongwangia harbinensis]MCA2211307.1 membrane protein insertase YidC [Jidongwangia harbinensis]
MSALFSPLMAAVYSAISAVLLFWHAVWERLLGDASGWHTDWSWVLGIVFLVLTVRTALIPVVNRQMAAQRAMQALQPKVAALQSRHRGDRVALQQELAALYRAEKVNPLMSFLPILLQAPVLIGLLHVLRHLRPSIASDAARTLYGWTLAQFDSASQATLFGAPIAATFNATAAQLQPLGAGRPTVTVVAAVLIALMAATTYLTSRMTIRSTGWAPEPQARTVQRLMLYGVPLSLLVSGAFFPIGVVLYWLTQSLFGFGQQMWILRRYPPPRNGAGPAR